MLNIYKTKSMKKLNKECEEFNPEYAYHQISLFKHMLVNGPTGSGKTNFILNLIKTLNGCFNHIFIYTGDPSENLYKMISQKLKDRITIEPIEKIPSLSELEPTLIGQSLMVIDDFITQKAPILSKIEEYAIRARKKSMTCCFLTQSFYSCPKKVRNNVKYLVMLKLCDKRNFGTIMSSIDSCINPETVKSIISNATREPLNVCIIDLQSKDANKTFRRNFTDYYTVEENGYAVLPQLYSGSGIIN